MEKRCLKFPSISARSDWQVWLALMLTFAVLRLSGCFIVSGPYGLIWPGVYIFVGIFYLVWRCRRAENPPRRQRWLSHFPGGLPLWILVVMWGIFLLELHNRPGEIFFPPGVQLLLGGSKRSLAFLLVGVAGMGALSHPRLRRAVLLPGLALLFVATMVAGYVAAMRTLDGHLPWGHDYPSFMYRIWEFGEVFPAALGGYNPWWNAGIEHFVGVTSGAHVAGLLLWPLLQFFPPHVVYPQALFALYLFAIPLLTVASFRAAGIRWGGALCGGILMCAVSSEFFRWMWHFGTSGAATSALLAAPVLALGYRLAIRRRHDWPTVLALAFLVWLMCLWTPGFMVAAGMFAGWLWNARRWRWTNNRRIIAAGILAVALLAPWWWIVLFPARNVVEYVGTKMATPAWVDIWHAGWRNIAGEMLKANPLLLFWGVLGIIGVVPRGMRRWTLPTVLILFIVAGWATAFKPLSQMDRMILPLLAASAFPAAMVCGRLLAQKSRWAAVGQGGLCMGLLLVALTVREIYQNRGVAPMRTLPPPVEQFFHTVENVVPPHGRLLFAGKAVHAYGGGNIAYWPVWTGREMMADDYYAFPRGTIEYNYPPHDYRKNQAKYDFFTDTYGVTHITTYLPDHIALLNSRPDRYRLVHEQPQADYTLYLYEIRRPHPLPELWRGTGHVEAGINCIRVQLEEPASQDVFVIRYNWRNGLRTRTPGAQIEPVDIDENIRLIGIRPGTNTLVEITYRPHWAPVEPNFDGNFHH